MKEVKIQYKGKEETVKLRELTWGEQNDCIRKSTTVVKGVRTMDEVTLHEQRLLQSIEEAPFPKTIEGLRALSNITGDLLFNEMQDLVKLVGDDSKNLETPSMQENSQQTESSTTSS